jgi:predicted RNase H-like nuclease (RuvC/YqgF family)
MTTPQNLRQLAKQQNDPQQDQDLIQPLLQSLSKSLNALEARSHSLETELIETKQYLSYLQQLHQELTNCQQSLSQQSQSQQYTNTHLAQIDQHLSHQAQIDSNQLEQLTRISQEVALLKNETIAVGQNQGVIHRSFHDFNQSFLILQERLTNLEDKTGQRLATLTQQTEQIQQAIPNKTAFPLKLFLSGEVVTYRGILGTLTFSGMLVAAIVWILLQLLPPANQSRTQQLVNSNEIRLDRLEQGQQKILDKLGIQPQKK